MISLTFNGIKKEKKKGCLDQIRFVVYLKISSFGQ